MAMAFAVNPFRGDGWLAAVRACSDGVPHQSQCLGAITGCNCDECMEELTKDLMELQAFENARLEEERFELYQLLTSKPFRRIKMRAKGGQSFWLSALRGVGFVSGLPIVGASPASAPPGSSTSQSYAYGVGAATFILLILGLVGFWLKCYRKRERGDGERGVLDVLFRPRPSGMYFSLDNLKTRELSVNGLIMDSRVGGSFVGGHDLRTGANL